MSSILDLLAGKLDSSTIAQMGERIGAAPEQVKQAVEVALPLILEALRKDLGSLAGAAAGGDLLARLFGGGRTAVELAVAKASGLGGAAVAQLMAMLTPLVLGVLAQARRDGGADAGGAGDLGNLGDMVTEALGRLQQAAPDLATLVGNLLGPRR